MAVAGGQLQALGQREGGFAVARIGGRGEIAELRPGGAVGIARGVVAAFVARGSEAGDPEHVGVGQGAQVHVLAPAALEGFVHHPELARGAVEGTHQFAVIGDQALEIGGAGGGGGGQATVGEIVIELDRITLGGLVVVIEQAGAEVQARVAAVGAQHQGVGRAFGLLSLGAEQHVGVVVDVPQQAATEGFVARLGQGVVGLVVVDPAVIARAAHGQAPAELVTDRAADRTFAEELALLADFAAHITLQFAGRLAGGDVHRAGLADGPGQRALRALEHFDALHVQRLEPQAARRHGHAINVEGDGAVIHRHLVQRTHATDQHVEVIRPAGRVDADPGSVAQGAFQGVQALHAQLFAADHAEADGHFLGVFLSHAGGDGGGGQLQRFGGRVGVGGMTKCQTDGYCYSVTTLRESASRHDGALAEGFGESR